MSTSEEYLCSANPEADPDEIARFVKGLGERDLIVIAPGDTIPVGYVLLSAGEVIRQTNPVVWSRPPLSPVAIMWGDARVYSKEDDESLTGFVPSS